MSGPVARLLLWCVLLPIPLNVGMAALPDSVDFRLGPHQWEHRLLLVFASSEADARWADQREALRGEAEGVRERDLLLLTLRADGEQGRLQSGPEESARPLTTAAVRRLYDRFAVSPDAFRVVLVGKDGTEKRRAPEPVTARSLFDTIDAMPMRQREMREDNGPGR